MAGSRMVRIVAGLGVPVAVGIGLYIWMLQGSSSAAPASTSVTRAVRGDLVVTVGGVGRIVQAARSAQITVPAAAGGNTSAGSAASASSNAPGASGQAGGGAGGATAAPADAVFPRASGHVVRFLVHPGQRVVAGQPLALVDDGGSAAAVTKQAGNDLATALLELLQKRTSDPLKGPPPTQAELAAGRFAVTSTFAQLAKLLGPPRAADVSAAQLDLKRARADLETLLGGSPRARAEAIRLARINVRLAQDRLDRVVAPPDAADVRAAKAEVARAEADLAVLLRPAPGPLPEAVAAAQQAVTVARQKLADAQAAGDPALIGAAQLELDTALADLATLLRPDPGPLPQEIDAARQAVDAAHAKLAKLLRPPYPADVRAARLDLERARVELRALETGPSRTALAAACQAVDAFRAKLGQLNGPPLPADVALAKLDVRKAEAELAVLLTRGTPATPIDIGLARLKVAAARIRLRLARLDGRLLTVRAPSAGTVTALLTVPGAPVDASTGVVAVDDLDRLAVTVELSEFDAAHVRKGLQATVSVDALGGKSFPGKVQFAALTGTETNGVVTFPVRVSLAHVKGLKPGMNVSVHITVARRRNVVQVPLEAVSRDDNDRPIVTTIDTAGDESTRRVELGLANNKNVEIVKGLRAGEVAVLAETQGGEE
jgi:RND family efflux transporter MFP subunit